MPTLIDNLAPTLFRHRSWPQLLQVTKHPNCTNFELKLFEDLCEQNLAHFRATLELEQSRIRYQKTLDCIVDKLTQRRHAAACELLMDPTVTHKLDDLVRIVEMAKDPYGTYSVQMMLHKLDKHSLQNMPDEHYSGIFVVRAVTHSLAELMFHKHGIFVIESCFRMLLRVDLGQDADVIKAFSGTVCEKVRERWDSLLSVRNEAISYKMVMWTLEFLFLRSMEDEALREFCERALTSADQLMHSVFGHHVLQHAVLFTQKAVVRRWCSQNPRAPSDFAGWIRIRRGFLDYAENALCDEDRWRESPKNPASHFINMCLQLYASDKDRVDTDLTQQRKSIISKVVDDGNLYVLICCHAYGRFTARRLYDLGSSTQRKIMKMHTKYNDATILNKTADLKKFKASLFSRTSELDFPQVPPDFRQAMYMYGESDSEDGKTPEQTPAGWARTTEHLL